MYLRHTDSQAKLKYHLFTNIGFVRFFLAVFQYKWHWILNIQNEIKMGMKFETWSFPQPDKDTDDKSFLATTLMLYPVVKTMACQGVGSFHLLTESSVTNLVVELHVLLTNSSFSRRQLIR